MEGAPVTMVDGVLSGYSAKSGVVHHAKHAKLFRDFRAIVTRYVKRHGDRFAPAKDGY